MGPCNCSNSSPATKVCPRGLTVMSMSSMRATPDEASPILNVFDCGTQRNASHFTECLWAARPYSKAPQREGIAAEFLASTRVLWETGDRQLEAEIGKLKTKYVFRNESAITQFVLGHRTVAAVLLNAVPELKQCFGEDVVFNLEAVSDDDESTSLYAIVVWRGLTEGAV